MIADRGARVGKTVYRIDLEPLEAQPGHYSVAQHVIIFDKQDPHFCSFRRLPYRCLKPNAKPPLSMGGKANPMDGVIQIGPLALATERLTAVAAIWAFKYGMESGRVRVGQVW